MPPRALSLAGWALLPLRAFLGITFTFAGLQKLANPNFFNANNPGGIQAQLIASDRISPLHFILQHLIHLATPIGVLIALAELAVGLGTLLGLWARLAAIGGFALSLTLFLTVSYHTSPYYTGADIVFMFAWLPLILAGAGGVWSLDRLIDERARREVGEPDGEVVAIPFSVVQQLCGNYDAGECRARKHAPCEVAPCPFLATGQRRVADGVEDLDRRRVVMGAGAVAAAGVLGAAIAGTDAVFGRAAGGTKPINGGTTTLSQPSSTTTTTSHGVVHPTPENTTPQSGTDIGAAKDVPVGGAAAFSDPSTGDPAIVLQPRAGEFLAYDAVCPHAACTVGYSTAVGILVCPCHGSQFNPTNGAVVQGPATCGLTAIKVTESGGQLFAG